MKNATFKLFKSTSPNAGGKALARQLVRSAKEPAPADLLAALGDEAPDDIDKLREALP